MSKLIIVGLIFLLSCNSNPQTNSKVVKTVDKSYKISVDRFLNDKNIPQLSKDLYLGKVRPTDNEENLSLIDSINSSGQARGFYFLAITKSMKFADGAYSEPLGIAAKAYVEDNTIEFLSYFIDNKDKLTEEDYKNWANFVYGEIQIESEGTEQKAVNDLKAKMINNCKDLSEEYKTRIDKFIGLMK